MGREDKKNEVIRTATCMEFHPVQRVDKRELQRYMKIPMTEIAGLGTTFAEMVPGFRTVTSTSIINTEGLWRCSYPSGVTGQLAEFKDGSGNLGTIMSNNRIVGQARWNPAKSVTSVNTFTVPVSPLNMFMAAALIEMNHKIDQIQRLGEEILSYQKERDRAELEANFEALTDTYDKLKYNLQEETWQKLKYSDVQSIKRQTAAHIKLLRNQIEKSINKRDLFHNKLQTDQMIRNVQNDFRSYRMAIFMYCFATFLEVLLQGNFSKEYLEEICNDLNHRAVGYKEFYTDCYNKLEHSSKTTVESKLLKGIAKASSDAGRTIRKIPIVEKGLLDEALIYAGDTVSGYNRRQTDSAMQDFTANMQSGARQFIDGIQRISQLYNSPMEVMIDADYVYLKLGTQ